MTEDLPVPLSREMRELAQANRLAARAFVAPLLPSGEVAVSLR